jgi:hypothetical protein
MLAVETTVLPLETAHLSLAVLPLCQQAPQLLNHAGQLLTHLAGTDGTLSAQQEGDNTQHKSAAVSLATHDCNIHVAEGACIAWRYAADRNTNS